MKRALIHLTLLLSGFFFLITGTNAQYGKVLESLSMKSVILGKEVKYSIFLPPDYETSSRSYPVVYLLHGYTDNETGWIQFGEVQMIAGKAIADQKIPPMIIVMPDGGVSWYINDYQGKVRWEDMLVQEFIPFIDKTYRTRPDKQYRGIAGLSMGGYGSLVNCFRHTDLFAACAAFSAGVFTDEELSSQPQDMFDGLFGHLYGENLTGTARLTDHWKKYSVINLAETIQEDQLKSVRIWIDCGDDDFLTIGNAVLHIALTKRHIPHEYRVRDGSHTWEYWRTGLVDGLGFIGQGFHR